MQSTDREQRLAKAMWAALDALREQIGGFPHWPEALKGAFADAILSREPFTAAEIQRTQELAAQYGWKRTPGC